MPPLVVGYLCDIPQDPDLRDELVAEPVEGGVVVEGAPLGLRAVVPDGDGVGGAVVRGELRRHPVQVPGEQVSQGGVQGGHDGAGHAVAHPVEDVGEVAADFNVWWFFFLAQGYQVCYFFLYSHHDYCCTASSVFRSGIPDSYFSYDWIASDESALCLA